MKETNPSGMATRNSASSGVQLTCLPVEILDMILSHNLSSLADFQAARQTSRVFRRVVMQSKEFKRRLGKAHIILDSDMTKKAVKLWQFSVWREITHPVVARDSPRKAIPRRCSTTLARSTQRRFAYSHNQP